MPRPAVLHLRTLVDLSPLLAACSQGRDIGRIDTDATLHLGQTTSAEILAKYGPPLSQAAASSITEQLPERRIMSSMDMTLAYGIAWIGPTQVSRATIFGFRQGTLNVVLSADTVEADQPDLDPARVEHLFAGAPPTRAALIAAFGPPQLRALSTTSPTTETDGWVTFVRRGLGTRSLPAHWVAARVFIVRFGADNRPAAHSFVTDDSA